MRKLLRFYLPYKKYLALAVLCNMLMSVFMVVSIPVLQPFLQILFGKDLPAAEPAATAPNEGGWSFQQIENQSSQFFRDLILEHGRDGALAIVCAFLVLVFFGKNLFRYLSLYFLAPARNNIVRDIRSKLVGKFMDLPLAFFGGERKGDLMSRITSDVGEIEFSIMGVLEAVVREPIVIFGSLAFMIFISPSLTLFAFGLLLFAGAVIGTVGRSLRKQSSEVQTRLGMVVSLIEETLSGLRIIKGFNAEKFQAQRFNSESTAYARTLTRLNRRRDLAAPLSEFLGIAVVALLMWYGARQVFSGSLSAETFITFLYAFFNVIDPAKAFSNAIYSIRKGMGALDRIEAVLAADVSIHDPAKPLEINGFHEKIEFRNVSFRYANAETAAVENIQLSIPKGRMVALVGASGAGKSTLADLLPRFYDPTEGDIFLDGKNLRDLRLRDLRGLMGIVSQEAVLFNDTVWNNIAFGMENADEQAVTSAARAANAHDFISELPQGYHTNIGDRGSKLSGGQRQRLTIARALLKNPPILILDEATSALDSESEKLVQAALERLMQNRTALVIAHRLSTVQHADEIIVMDRGRIVERGTHDALMSGGKFYRKLVELQALG
ncbi:MAG: ABC transporter ATP-binding protein [Saprospiraceae bacterium]